jgi:hypothetical protein
MVQPAVKLEVYLPRKWRDMHLIRRPGRRCGNRPSVRWSMFLFPRTGARSLTARKNEGVPEELLLRVAWFYYKDELTQEEIAKRLSVSRA